MRGVEAFLMCLGAHSLQVWAKPQPAAPSSFFPSLSMGNPGVPWDLSWLLGFLSVSKWPLVKIFPRRFP